MSVSATNRRQGFGRMVVEALIVKALERGVTEVVVRTDTPWTSAVELYLACGFTEVDRDDIETHFSVAVSACRR
jgi:N-acetylglutamate synthase-like GNAT family acetyltransferase